jgi:predicted ATP-grasp superfamily ATP-dependent carboligase
MTNGEDMVTKFKKGNNNILIEVGPQTRKQILQTKLKLGWEICSTKDYVAKLDATDAAALITNTTNLR